MIELTVISDAECFNTIFNEVYFGDQLYQCGKFVQHCWDCPVCPVLCSHNVFIQKPSSVSAWALWGTVAGVSKSVMWCPYADHEANCWSVIRIDVTSRCSFLTIIYKFAHLFYMFMDRSHKCPCGNPVSQSKVKVQYIISQFCFEPN
jgi:hypothetical protein